MKIIINGLEAEVSDGVSLEQVQEAITEAISNIQPGITEEEADSKYMGRLGGELTGDEAENGFSFSVVNDSTLENRLSIQKSNIISEVVGESGTSFVNIGEWNIKLSSINYDGIENTSINIDGSIGAVSIYSSGNTLNIDEDGATINSEKIMTENATIEQIQTEISNALDGIQTGITEEQADERYLQLSGGTLSGPLMVPEPEAEGEAASKGYVDGAIAAALPAKSVIMWSGAVNAIPAGWALCNGSNGTPDLRNRFVVGAGSTYAVGATGGEETHTLTISEMPSHNHDFYYANYNKIFASTGSVTTLKLPKTLSSESGGSNTLPIANKGGGAAHNNLPPYYALCYIMKL